MEEPSASEAGPCLAARIGEWFGRQHVAARASAPSVEAVTHARQTNMALALAASKWLEFDSLDPDPVGRMREWIAQTLERAEARGADARADAMRLVGGWLEECARTGPRPSDLVDRIDPP